MIRFPAPPPSLCETPDYRRLVKWSAGSHLLLFLVLVFAPGFRMRPPLEETVYVEVLAAAPSAPAPEPAPRKPKVDEAVVIPKQPREVSKPEPKAPKVEEKPEDKPKPRPKTAPTRDDILGNLRAKQASRDAQTSETQKEGGVGILDPVRAAYQRKVRDHVYANWAGAAQFSRIRGIQAAYRVSLDPGGRVLDVELVRSSGEPGYDRSVERAISKSSPLPPPPGGPRSVLLTFDPERLR